MVDFCQSPPPFLADTGATRVRGLEWDEPIFHDNSNGKVRVTKSHTFGDFPVGVTSVTYVARDEAGNKAMCEINITVQGKHL